jgi:DNA polymerase I
MNKNELLNLLNQMDKEPQNNVDKNPHERVLLIDSLNLFFRNFAVMNFVNENGVHIGGMGGFVRSLISLIKQIKPTSVYVVFDGKGSSTNRKNILPEYKSGRNVSRITNWDVFENLEEEHDSKIDQITRLIHYLRCLPVKILSIDKVEADDIIAHISNVMSTKYNSQVFMVSNDQDFIQLVNDKITLYHPARKDYFTPQTIIDSFSVLSENFIIYKTLLGDQSDKVIGVKGLGKKGVIKRFPELLERFVSFEDLIEICASKYKEHIVYSRIIFERERLESNYKIMDLKNPLMTEQEKQFVDSYINEPVPSLNVRDFLHLYNEDGLGKMIRNPEFTIKETFKDF